MTWVFLCMPLLAHAAVDVAGAGEQAIPLNPQLQWWSQGAGGELIADAQQAPFVPAPAGPAYGVSRTPVWFRIDFENTAADSRESLVELGFVKLDLVDAWLVRRDGSMQHWATGDARPYATRPLRMPRFVFPFTLAPDEHATFYLRVDSSLVINVPLALHDAQAYTSVASVHFGGLGLFYGLVLALLAYNTYLFRTTREVPFLHYVIACILATGYFLSVDGFVAALLDDVPALSQRLLFYCGTLSVTFTLLFARGFLDLQKLAPRLDRLIVVVAAIAAVMTPAEAFLPPLVAMLATIVLSIVMAALMTMAGLIALRAKFAPARWFMLAISVHLSVLVLVTLGALGAAPGLFAWADIAHRIGFVLNFACFTLAIGERIRQIEEARHAAEKRVAEAAADLAARNAFLSRMSHELRTPMTGVLGMAELLDHTALEPVQRRYLGTLRYSGEILLNLINDMLDHARLLDGRLRPRQEAFDLLRLLDECRALFSQQPRSDDVGITVGLGASVSRIAVGDGPRVKQLLINLLSIAYRHSARDVVSVQLRAAGDTGWIRFDIVAGLPPEHDKANLSAQVAALADELEGIAPAGPATGGIGLSICRELVELMRGRIGVAGGERLSFWFELPLHAAE